MDHGVDAERFPLAAAYLARLPEGIRSYPDAKIRGGLVQSIITAHTLSARGALPDVVCDWIDSPPVTSEWVPQMMARVLLRAYFDAVFRTREAYLRWAYEAQKKTLSGPLYRVLFLGISPERLARMAASRYAHFHTGLTMTVTGHGPGRADAVLTYPPLLCDGFDHQATVEGLRAGLELAGATNVRGGATSSDDGSARVELRWD
jgi:hypothetical protein